MVRSIVIPQDTAQAVRLEELADTGEFQTIVDGWLDYMEILALGVTVYMNQAARREHRVINSRATALWWYYSARPTEEPVILGDVVLTGIADRCSWGDIPDAVVHELLERDTFVVQTSPHGNGVWFDSYARFDNFFDAALWCSLFSHALRQPSQFRIDGEALFEEPVETSGGEGGRSW